MRQIINISIIPGEKSCGQLDVLGDTLLEVVASISRIGGGQDAHSGVQRRHDAGFGNGDSLLFHDLVNGSSVLVSHLIKLVNAADSLVGKDQSSALQHHLPR